MSELLQNSVDFARNSPLEGPPPLMLRIWLHTYDRDSLKVRGSDLPLMNTFQGFELLGSLKPRPTDTQCHRPAFGGVVAERSKMLLPLPEYLLRDIIPPERVSSITYPSYSSLLLMFPFFIRLY